MSIPGYDAWKLACPYDDLTPEEEEAEYEDEWGWDPIEGWLGFEEYAR